MFVAWITLNVCVRSFLAFIFYYVFPDGFLMWHLRVFNRPFFLLDHNSWLRICDVSDLTSILVLLIYADLCVFMFTQKQRCLFRLVFVWFWPQIRILLRSPSFCRAWNLAFFFIRKEKHFYNRSVYPNEQESYWKMEIVATCMLTAEPIMCMHDSSLL